MMVSMTGFGQAEARVSAERFIVTLKSVNHRYFETAFHIPTHFEHLEAAFRGKIQKKINRGRITISIAHINESADEILLNENLVEKYHQVLERVRRKLKLEDGVDISSLVSLPGVLRTQKEELGLSQSEKLLKSALNAALEKLVVMKRREGEALARDLKKRVRQIASHVAAIKRIVVKTVAATKKTMPPENWESFLRSTDVSEEVTRIDFHLKSFLKHMTASTAKGKVLDFVGQELQREVNTLGAKIQDKNVAYQVVMVKDQIEKIREQVQNVE